MTFTLPALRPHQEVMAQHIVDNPRCAVWLTIGGGKTLSTLTGLARVRPHGHILVVAPLAIARSVWINEIEKFGFPLRTKSLIVNERDKPLTRAKRLERYEQIFTDAPTMYFISVDLIHDLVENMPIRKNADGKRERVWPFPTVILEESQGYKNPSSRRFKSVKKIREACLRIIELSGSPSPQSLLDIWSQVFLLDGGAALGERFTEYRGTYFHPKAIINGRPVSWEINYGAEEVIHDKIKHLALSAKADIGVVRLPDQVMDIVMPSYVRDAYREFRKKSVLELAMPDPNDPRRMIITADNAAVLRSKLLQFASGTIYTGDDHKTDYAVTHNEKLEVLSYLVNQDRSSGENTIVAYRYQCDQARIIGRLKKDGITAEFFDGSRAMVNRWNSGQIPVLLLQPASTAHGVNLQEGGRHLIWYSLPDSLEHWLQTNGRVERMGQADPVQITSLVTKDTQDAYQPGLLSRKDTGQQALLKSVMAEIAEVLEDAEDYDDIAESLDNWPI